MSSQISVLDRIDPQPNGIILIRLAKQTIVADAVVEQGWHRTSLFPGCDVAGTIAAVDKHLGQMGYSPVPEADWQRVKDAAAELWTPEVIDAYRSAAG